MADRLKRQGLGTAVPVLLPLQTGKNLDSPRIPLLLVKALGMAEQGWKVLKCLKTAITSPVGQAMSSCVLNLKPGNNL